MYGGVRGHFFNSPTVHFYRNVFANVPKAKGEEVAAMLKAIHAQEDREASLQKARLVIDKLNAMKLKAAARTVEEGIAETLTYTEFPREHWLKIRTNNPMERVMREIRRRTRVVGNFPDGNSTLMLVTARLRYVAGKKWGTRKYMNMRLLTGGTAIEEALQA
jgi:putative transposase